MPNRPSQRQPIDLSLLLRAKALRTARAAGSGITKPLTAKRPSPPKHLTEAARVVWRRTAKQMLAANTWKPAYAELLSLYSELRAVFDKDPAAFSPTKLVTLRLLARDLGLSPGTAAAPTLG